MLALLSSPLPSHLLLLNFSLLPHPFLPILSCLPPFSLILLLFLLLSLLPLYVPSSLHSHVSLVLIPLAHFP